MKNKHLKMIFFGTPEFSNIVLQKLIDSNYKPFLVVTQPDKPTGRKKELVSSPVKILAQKNNIPVIQPKKLKNYKLPTTNYQLGIVASYGKIIPTEILEIPKYGTLNIHPSLLPKYRGPSPIQATILNKDKKTGVTIMKMDKAMDHGPVIKSEKLKIKNEKFTYEILVKKLFKIGADLLIEILPDYLSGKIKPKEQSHVKATYTKIIKKEDGLINWNKPADHIERQLHAYTPWPGIYTFFNGKRLKVLKLEISEYTIGTPGVPIVGQVIKYDDGFAVQTGNGLAVINTVQLEGKNPQTAKEFLNGHPGIIKSTLN